MIFLQSPCGYAAYICCENVLISRWLSPCPCCAALSSNMLRISDLCQRILCVTACMVELQVCFQVSIQVPEPSTQRQQVSTPQCITTSLCVSQEVCKLLSLVPPSRHFTTKIRKKCSLNSKRAVVFICHACLSLEELTSTTMHSRIPATSAVFSASYAIAGALHMLIRLLCGSAEYRT